MAHFRIVLEYDGSDFEGWQTQSHGGRTVQGCVIAALEKLSQGPVRVTGSGRTDAGVHAEGQVASIALETQLPPEQLSRALNGNLPRDLAVIACEAATPEFDARRDARSKLYVYRIWNGPQRSPLRTRRQMTVLRRLDAKAMARAARDLVGEHDFRSLQASGSNVTTTVRTLTRVDVVGEAGSEIAIEVEGSGFLRYMVRNIAGTLIEVGRGQREADSMLALLAAVDRARAGPTAQARGLTLVRVDYAGPQR
jgi:tRNA pseudouridine38-40 synthase